MVAAGEAVRVVDVIGFLFSIPGKIAVVVTVLTLAYGVVYLQGRNAEKTGQLKDTVKAHDTRNQIDQDVDANDPVADCLELGGLPVNCAKLRGLDAASEGE